MSASTGWTCARPLNNFSITMHLKALEPVRKWTRKAALVELPPLARYTRVVSEFSSNDRYVAPQDAKAAAEQAFIDRLNSLTVEDAEKLLESLTDRDSELLGLQAQYLDQFHVALELGVTDRRVRQIQSRVWNKFDVKNKSQAILLFVVARLMLRKPVYLDSKLTRANQLLQESRPDQSNDALLDLIDSPEFELVIEDLRAGGLRAMRRRLGRWFVTAIIAGTLLFVSVVTAMVILIALGLDAINS